MTTTQSDRQLIGIAIAVVLVVVLLPPLVMGGMWGGGMMGGMWGPMMGDSTVPSWLFWVGAATQVVVLLLVVGVAVVAYRALSGTDTGRDPAMEELRHAYARGDLTDDEYESRREKLERE